MKNKNNRMYLDPSLIPPKDCPSIFPAHCPSPPAPLYNKKWVTDEICGGISQPCNGEWVMYWNTFSLKKLPTASITILNSCGCVIEAAADTTGNGELDTFLFAVRYHSQSRSVTLPQIASLFIRCQGESSNECFGNYCINLHYEI
jgi:hypothetical protein